MGVVWGIVNNRWINMTYRNRRLLDVVRYMPRCSMCGRSNDGTIVAAHSNQLLDGKGMGTKAADYRVAGLCFYCHASLDQGAAMSKEEKRDAWESAHRATVGWLFESGCLTVGEPNEG